MTQPFALGQQVRAVARVHFVYNDHCKKYVWRDPLPEPLVGTVLGYTFRQTGSVLVGRSGWEEPYYPAVSEWYPEKYHKVWLIGTTTRWKEPYLCLESDLEALEQEPS